MELDAAQTIRQWAAEVGWQWPDDAPTPAGVYAAIGDRLSVSSEYVRAVFSGRQVMPAAWPERWAHGPPMVPGDNGGTKEAAP